MKTMPMTIAQKLMLEGYKEGFIQGYTEIMEKWLGRKMTANEIIKMYEIMEECTEAYLRKLHKEYKENFGEWD